MWTTEASKFRPHRMRVIESIFRHHPDAHVRIYSNTLEDALFGALAKAGRTIEVVPFNVTAVFEGTPLLAWSEGAAKDGQYFFSHLTDGARYALLWKHGGIYVDMDVLVTRPMTDMYNAVGCEA